MRGKVYGWMTSRACVDCACLGKQRSVKPAECASCAYGKDAAPIEKNENDNKLIISFEGMGHGLIEIPERFKEMIMDNLKYALDNMTEEEYDEEGLTGMDVTVEHGGKKYMLTSDWEEIVDQQCEGDGIPDNTVICPYCEELLEVEEGRDDNIMVCTECHNNFQLSPDYDLLP